MPIPFLWERLTCNDEAAAVLARELKISPAIARLLAIRGIDDLESAQKISPAVARSSARSVQARGHGAGGRADSRGDRAEGTHRHSRRLRLRRHHLDGHPSPRAGVVRRQRRALPSRSHQGRIRPPARDVRSSAGRRCDARHLGRLRHSRHRGGEARARAAHRSDHHGSPRARHGAADCRRRDQPAAPRLRLPRQESRGRRRRAEARAGALPQTRSRAAAAGVHQGRGHRHAGRRRPARRREPRHREARPRPAVAGPAQGRAARADRSGGPDRQSRSTAVTWRFRSRRA